LIGYYYLGKVKLDYHYCLFPAEPTSTVQLTNHDKDYRLACVDDIEFQASQTVVSAHWAVTGDLAPYITTAWWKIWEMEDVVDSKLNLVWVEIAIPAWSIKYYYDNEIRLVPQTVSMVLVFVSQAFLFFLR
jgi:hypothetical protein